MKKKIEKILVVGGGLTGCTIARLLKDDGYVVEICEKEGIVGGLCISRVSSNGIIYEPFGARTFHTKHEEVRKFIQRFAIFNTYEHHKGCLYKKKLYHYPINYETISKMSESKKILQELADRPKEIDKTNFETAMLSIFGATLYKMFIENYSRKFWGIDPKLLEAEWAPSRVELKEREKGIFEGQWQGLPKGGYNELFEKMVSNIPVHINSNYNDYKNCFDIVIYTGKIDSLFNHKLGHLPYRSIEFKYVIDEKWENERYGTINLSDDPSYFRKCNFKILHQQDINGNYIQYQNAVSENKKNPPMYPINTKVNNELFDKYLKLACEEDTIIPMGRLGLYKYLDMDKAVLLAIRMKNIVGRWKTLKPEQRYQDIKKYLQEI